MRSAREVLITGSVQGVGFRWTAKRIADRIGVDGWVRNNPDGSVSLALEGTDAAMNEFMESLDEAVGVYMVSVKSTAVKPGKNRDGFDVVH